MARCLTLLVLLSLAFAQAACMGPQPFPIARKRKSKSDLMVEAIHKQQQERRRKQNLLDIDKLEERLAEIKVFRGFEIAKKLLDDKITRRKAQEEKIRKEMEDKPEPIEKTATKKYRSSLFFNEKQVMFQMYQTSL